MANPSVRRLQEFAGLQMASEAFLVRSGDGRSVAPDTDVSSRLEEGNFHASHFISLQAEKFVKKYRILAQFRNDPQLSGGSGFSGTLFQDIGSEELTLSFRSTEFIDDNLRDSKSTNELEVKEFGWALGQISEMEAWYAQLRADPELLGGKKFNVTGYSLGGHLATAFNILRREDARAGKGDNPILATYTFNGAGVGDLKPGKTLSGVIAKFAEYRAQSDIAASEMWRQLPLQTRTLVLREAESRILQINSEQARLRTLAGVQYAFGATEPPSGIQGTLDYQIAALLAARDTIASSRFFGTDVNTIPTVPKFADAIGRDRIPSMIEVVGSDAGNLGPSWVSNSGVHYGTRQEIYIEDQPLFRGTYSLPTDLGKLVSNPAENDFADTHSLVLLQDSLSLMALLERLDPSIDIEAARQIYASVSGAQATSVFGSQGVAEGDVLERTLDALRAIFFGPDVEPTVDYAETLAGNTWHLSSLRLPFHQKLHELDDHVAGLMSEPGLAPRFVLLSKSSASELQALATDRGGDGFAYRYALRELNPFALLGVGYGQHNVDGSLELDGTLAGALSGMTAEYLADRSAMLAWKNLDYVGNGKAVLRSADGVIYRYTDYQLQDSDGGELSFVIHGVRAGSVGEPAFISFGSDQDDTLTGGNISVGDCFYGADGDDTIEGRAGADYLEGDSGDDTLKGGADDDMLVGGVGFDTYAYDEGDGFDTVTDSDGLGRIVYNGRSLGGGAKIGDNVYKDAFDVEFIVVEDDIDGQSLLIDGSIFVDNFKGGDLGIHLEGHVDLPARPEGAGTHVYADSVHPQDFDPADDEQFSFLRDLYGSRGDDSFLTSGQIAIFGRAGNDTAVVGEGAAYAVRIDLGGGDDLIDAGASSGASGTGQISGGGGNDYIVGSPGDDIVWGDNYLAVSEFSISEGAPKSMGAYRIDGVIYNAELPPGEGLFGLLPPGYGIFSVVVEDVQLYDATDQASADAVLVPDGSMIAGTLEHVISVVVGDSAAFDDYIEAGDGNDHVTGGSGADDIFGGAGDDVLVGDYGAGAIRLPSYAALRKGFG